MCSMLHPLIISLHASEKSLAFSSLSNCRQLFSFHSTFSALVSTLLLSCSNSVLSPSGSIACALSLWLSKWPSTGVIPVCQYISYTRESITRKQDKGEIWQGTNQFPGSADHVSTNTIKDTFRVLVSFAERTQILFLPTRSFVLLFSA